MAGPEVVKMKQGMSYSSKEKTIILNVFKYLRSEMPDKCITDIVRRTAKATGCSEKSIFQFRKEEASPQGFKEPSKTKVRRYININSRDIKYDTNVRQSIRNIIYNLKSKNLLPSLNKILKQVEADDTLPKFSLMTLRRLLFDMGFYYEKNGSKYVLLEKSVATPEWQTAQINQKLPLENQSKQTTSEKAILPSESLQGTKMVGTGHTQPMFNYDQNKYASLYSENYQPAYQQDFSQNVQMMLNVRRDLLPPDNPNMHNMQTHWSYPGTVMIKGQLQVM